MAGWHFRPTSTFVRNAEPNSFDASMPNVLILTKTVKICHSTATPVMLLRHGAMRSRAPEHAMNAKTDKKPVPRAPALGMGTPLAGLRRLVVAELLAGDREVILEHDGQDYRLRITANGKLILTK